MVAIIHPEVHKTYPSSTGTGARRFVGKTAIVVGASANVGKALSELLAQEGADVVVHYNSVSKQAQAEVTAATIRGHGQQVRSGGRQPFRAGPAKQRTGRHAP